MSKLPPPGPCHLLNDDICHRRACTDCDLFIRFYRMITHEQGLSLFDAEPERKLRLVVDNGPVYKKRRR